MIKSCFHARMIADLEQQLVLNVQFCFPARKYAIGWCLTIKLNFFFLIFVIVDTVM